MDWETAKTFGPLGLVVVALYLLARDWISRHHTREMKKLEQEGRRIDIDEKRADLHVTTLTSLISKVDSHAAADMHGHQEMAAGIASLHGKLDGVLDERDRTPVEGVRRQTPAQGVQIAGGYYQQQRRPGTKGDR